MWHDLDSHLRALPSARWKVARWSHPRVVSRVQGSSVLRAGRQGAWGSPSGSRGLETPTMGVLSCVPASAPAPAPP